MTVYEFYQWCVEHGYQDYELYSESECTVYPVGISYIDIDESQHRIIVE